MDLQLKDKVFLITGGSSGLGKALAEQLVAEGARGVALMDDLALKLMGAVRLTRLALPALRESHGAVVNTLAVSGKARISMAGSAR